MAGRERNLSVPAPRSVLTVAVRPWLCSGLGRLLLADARDDARGEIADLGVLLDERLDRRLQGRDAELVLDRERDDDVDRVGRRVADAAELLLEKLRARALLAGLAVDVERGERRGVDERDDAFGRDDGVQRAVAEDARLLFVRVRAADAVDRVEDDPPGLADPGDPDPDAGQVGDGAIDLVLLELGRDVDRLADDLIVEADGDGHGEDARVAGQERVVDRDRRTDDLREDDLRIDDRPSADDETPAGSLQG